MNMLNNLKNNLPSGYEDIINELERKFDIKENDELSDEQIDEICAFLSENAPRSTENMLKVPNNVLEVPDETYLNTMKDLRDTLPVSVTVNPATGLPDLSGNDTGINYADCDLDKASDSPTEEVCEEETVNNLAEQLDISDQEAGIILQRILTIDRSTEYDDAYDIMPESVKSIIDNNHLMIPDKSKNELANDFLRFLKQSIITKPVYTDLQQIAAKQDPEVLAKYMDTIRDVMENKMLEDAANETDKNKAKKLRDCSKAFTSSYTYDFIIDYIQNKRVPMKIKGKRLTLIKELEHDLDYYRTICARFSAKYTNSKFTINDITSILPILNRKLPIEEFDSDDNAMFVILLCKIFASKKVNNIVDHTLMYYTLKNIVSLDMMNEEETEFGKTIIQNLTDTIKFIKNYKK